MSKLIYIKWTTKSNNSGNQILKIYLTEDEAKSDQDCGHVDILTQRFWVVGTYDGEDERIYISTIKIDDNEPTLYFVKYENYYNWTNHGKNQYVSTDFNHSETNAFQSISCQNGIYVFMCDEDRNDFIKNDLIINFEGNKQNVIDAINKNKSCEFKDQICIKTFEINI